MTFTAEEKAVLLEVAKHLKDTAAKLARLAERPFPDGSESDERATQLSDE